MRATATPAATIELPRAFWLYLIALHVAYALVLTFRLHWLTDPSLTLRGFTLVQWASVLDLTLIPALLYAYLARKNTMQALFGALSMAALGLFAIRCWLPASAISGPFGALLALRQQLMPVVWLAIGAAELYIIYKIIQQLRLPMKEGAVEMILAPLRASLGASNWLVRLLGAEQRLWIYAFTVRLPQPQDFAGTQHFSTAEQNSNASTWYGFFLANTVPIPVLHVVIMLFSERVAWLVTVLTALSSLWLWAQYRAARARPISLDATTLYLRYGLWTDVQFARADLRAARTLSWRDLEPSLAARPLHHRPPLVLQGMGAPNCELEFSGGSRIRLGVDTPDAFVAALMPTPC
jgi:hypothetical protein